MKRRDFLITPALGLILPHSLGRAAAIGQVEPKRGAFEYRTDLDRFPQQLHQDFITYTPGIEYFILGNGDIIAVLQYAPDREIERPLTFAGLTIMDAEHFGRKWSTFLFHPEAGFSRSAAVLSVDGKGHTATPENFVGIDWAYPEKVPVVVLRWRAGVCEVKEELFVPAEGPVLVRRFTITNQGASLCDVTLRGGMVPNFTIFDEISSRPSERTVIGRGFASITLRSTDSRAETGGRYDLIVPIGSLPPGEGSTVDTLYVLRADKTGEEATSAAPLWESAAEYWKPKTALTSDNQLVNHLYDVSRTGLKSLVARSGKRDSGFWMYNMEWVRDDVMVVLGMLHTGLYDEARTLLRKMLMHSVGEDGRTIESSRWFGFDYTELDQNGELLFGVAEYVAWTGDEAFAREFWEKIRSVGEFPLQERFFDARARMVHNKREFWERSDSFGVHDGFELTYQFWVWLGLERAGELARRLGDAETAARWAAKASEIRTAVLHDPTYRMIEDGHLIKRRELDGTWQQFFIPPNRGGMPPGSPLATIDRPSCDPDTASALPIAYGMVEPQGEIAQKTLQHIEQLWNQRWSFGGYSRYNTDSEPDPPAPWPFGSLFVARAYAEAGDSDKVWRVLRWLGEIHGGKAGAWFERYGPSITPPAPPVSIVGWTWAEITGLIVTQMLGVRPALERLKIRPWLPVGLDRIEGSFILRGVSLRVEVTRTTGEPSVLVNGEPHPFKDGLLELPYSSGPSMEVQIRL
jgi:hypothetical protein